LEGRQIRNGFVYLCQDREESSLDEEAEIAIVRIIDSVSEWLGKYLSFLFFPLIGILFYEVITRYVFDSPTLWAHETAIFLFGTIGMFAGAYALLMREHVIFDLVYRQLSRRQKAIIDSATAIFFFLAIGVIIWQGWDMAYHSTMMGEHSASAWRPPLYPFKWVTPVAAFILFMQGIANFIRNIFFAIQGRELS